MRSARQLLVVVTGFACILVDGNGLADHEAKRPEMRHREEVSRPRQRERQATSSPAVRASFAE
jgi:hypothetical protein